MIRGLNFKLYCGDVLQVNCMKLAHFISIRKLRQCSQLSLAVGGSRYVLDHGVRGQGASQTHFAPSGKMVRFFLWKLFGIAGLNETRSGRPPIHGVVV